jgi:hypothetical protein
MKETGATAREAYDRAARLNETAWAAYDRAARDPQRDDQPQWHAYCLTLDPLNKAQAALFTGTDEPTGQLELFSVD